MQIKKNAHSIFHEPTSEVNIEKFQIAKQQLAANNTIAKIVLETPCSFYKFMHD